MQQDDAKPTNPQAPKRKGNVLEHSRLLSDVRRAVAHARALPSGSTNLAVALNSVNSAPGVPDPLQPFHLASPQERTRRVRDVLRNAWRLYRKGGLSISASVNAAADGSAAGEYAKVSLRRILLELNLDAWESHPNRTREDAHRLFRKAIGKLTPHRGGWRVAR